MTNETIYSIIEKGIASYTGSPQEIKEGVFFSQYELIKRIGLFENQTYPEGRIDDEGSYLYWYDITTSAMRDRIKNKDFDTKNIRNYSYATSDALPVYVLNLLLAKELKEGRHAEKINDFMEKSDGWGNMLIKKIKKDGKKTWQMFDPQNTYLTNIAAETIDETDIIERYEMTQSELKKQEAWNKKAIKEVIDNCAGTSFQSSKDSNKKDAGKSMYEIFEYNGEIPLEVFKQEKGIKIRKGDEDKFIMVKAVVSGLNQKKTGDKYTLYLEEIKDMHEVYEEYHEAEYNGRWWRVGTREALFDCQIRANETGNQIAKGLEYASKTLLSSEDKLIVQNAMEDLRNGDIIFAKNLKQVDLRMYNFDQLIGEWNRNLVMRDMIANSREVVQGIVQPSGTTKAEVEQMNFNANKLFEFIREKLEISLKYIYDEWMLQGIIDNLKSKDILIITGNKEYYDKIIDMIVDSWYLQNLIALPPHGPDVAMALKEAKKTELLKNKEIYAKNSKEFWAGVKIRSEIVITGENMDLQGKSQIMREMIAMETDGVRRRAMIENQALKFGVDISGFPKNPNLGMTPAPTPAPAMKGQTNGI